MEGATLRSDSKDEGHGLRGQRGDSEGTVIEDGEGVTAGRQDPGVDGGSSQSCSDGQCGQEVETQSTVGMPMAESTKRGAKMLIPVYTMTSRGDGRHRRSQLIPGCSPWCKQSDD